MDDLVVWLRAQLDEDERLAKAATPGRWMAGDQIPGLPQDFVHAIDYRPEGYSQGQHVAETICILGGTGPWVAQLRGSGFPIANARFIAEHDPARVLAEVEAKRRILNWCEQQTRLVDYPSAEQARPREAHRAADGHVYAHAGPDVGWIRLREQATRAEAHKVAQLLAVPYSHRPGYQESWRP